ncbi:MAG: hypothetical protein J5525_03300 [Lachnospiraceae bacterium]|nr:hypothetical protein [Lachnospiraceae bacterium]
MKRLKISAIILAFLLLLMGCNEAKDPIDNVSENPADEQITGSSSSLPSRNYFENLDKDSSLDDIVEQIGDCGYEGSGIIYHVWKLDDGSKAKLVFNSEGKIEFIYIVTDDSGERIYDRDNS